MRVRGRGPLGRKFEREEREGILIQWLGLCLGEWMKING